MEELDPLHRGVLADPDDDALRHVWADALIERGDPLGEVISLQLRAAEGPITSAQDKRLRSLVAKHKNAWLGELTAIVQTREGLTFDRGVLAACQIQVKKVDGLARATNHPLLAGLESIWFSDRFAHDPRIVDLLAAPVLGRLREIVCPGNNRVFPLLARLERPLAASAIWLTTDHWLDSPTSIQDVDEAPGLPRLRHLGLTLNGEETWATTLPIVDQLETLGITSPAPVQHWLDRTRDLAKLTMLEIRRDWIPIQGITRSHFCLRFTRDDRGAWSRLAIERVGSATEPMLEGDLASLVETDIAQVTLEEETIRPFVRRRFAHVAVDIGAPPARPFFARYARGPLER